MNFVQRINENMFTIDGTLAEVYEGEIEFHNGEQLNRYQYRAILEFIEYEEAKLYILAHRAVKELLKEMGVKTEEDINV